MGAHSLWIVHPVLLQLKSFLSLADDALSCAAAHTIEPSKPTNEQAPQSQPIVSGVYDPYPTHENQNSKLNCDQFYCARGMSCKSDKSRL